jgi:hypothetical protein
MELRRPKIPKICPICTKILIHRVNQLDHHVMTDPLILVKVQLHRGVSQEVASAKSSL